MYASAARLAFTSLLTSSAFGFSFVIHFTSIMYTILSGLFPAIRFDFFLYYYTNIHWPLTEKLKTFAAMRTLRPNHVTIRILVRLCQVSFTRSRIRRPSWAHWKARRPSGLAINVNWTFFARSYGLGAMSEVRSKIGDFVPTRSLWPKISGRRGRPPPSFFFSEN